MAASFEKLVYQGVLLVGEPQFRIPLFVSFHDRGTPTIMVRTFITLEEIFGASEADEMMFITLVGPPDDGEGISILLKYNTPMGVVPRISCPMGIPPKPLDVVAVSIISACDDHFYRKPIGTNARSVGEEVEGLRHHLCEFHLPTLSGVMTNPWTCHVV